MRTPRMFLDLTCSILFPFIIISSLAVLHAFSFGVNIMKLDLFTFNVRMQYGNYFSGAS